MEAKTLNDFLSANKSSMTKANIASKISAIITLYPKISFAGHMRNLMRGEKPYEWGDEKALSKIDSYMKELENDYNSDLNEWGDEPIK